MSNFWRDLCDEIFGRKHPTTPAPVAPPTATVPPPVVPHVDIPAQVYVPPVAPPAVVELPPAPAPVAAAPVSAPTTPKPGPGWEWSTQVNQWIFTGAGLPKSIAQQFLDAGGDPGNISTFQIFIANHYPNGGNFADIFTAYKAKVAQSVAERDAADKPIGDQGEAWKTRRYAFDADAYPPEDRIAMQGLLERWKPCLQNFNALQDDADAGQIDRMAPFVYLQAVCPNALVYFIPGQLQLCKMIREAFVSLQAGGSQMYRDALHVDNTKYTGDVSFVDPASAWLRHVGGPPFTGDTVRLPFGTLDLRNHGG